MVDSEQRLAQPVRILVGKFLTVEVGIGGMDDTMMVRAEDHDVSADIWTSAGEILDMVSFRKSDAVVRKEILAAHLTTIFVVRLETLSEKPISPVFLFFDNSSRHRF